MDGSPCRTCEAIERLRCSAAANYLEIVVAGWSGVRGWHVYRYVNTDTGRYLEWFADGYELTTLDDVRRVIEANSGHPPVR